MSIAKKGNQLYAIFTREDVVQVVVRGVILCSVPNDPQAHAEITVDGNLLTVEINGSFIDVQLPKGYGVHSK